MTSTRHRPTIVLATLAVVLLLVAASCSSGGGWPVERTTAFRLQQASIVAMAGQAAGPGQRACPFITTAQVVEVLGIHNVVLKSRKVQGYRSGSELGGIDGVGCDWTFMGGSHATRQLYVHTALAWMQGGFGEWEKKISTDSLQDGTYQINQLDLVMDGGTVGAARIGSHVVVFSSWQAGDTTGKPLGDSVQNHDVTLHDSLVRLRQRIVHNATS